MDSEPIICYDKLVDNEDYLLIEGQKKKVVVINSRLPQAEQDLVLHKIIRRFGIRLKNS
jgi:hypothetical protein